MSRTYDPETILKLDSTYTKACFTDQSFSLGDQVGQKFDAWYNGKGWLKAQNPNIGTAFHRNCSGNIHIFYLIIKKFNYSVASKTDISNALQDLIDQASALGITKIAFSAITPNEIDKNVLQTMLSALSTNITLTIM